jgi:hypothetical protein
LFIRAGLLAPNIVTFFNLAGGPAAQEDMRMLLLSLLFGAVVGFALGLTGGGGGVFAVPLLVYGLAVAPREAVGVSLAAVGGTALLGVLPRLRSGQVEIGTGLWFALAGMLGAPAGSWAAGQVSESLLLLLFAGVMMIVAWRMWRKAAGGNTLGRSAAAEKSEPTCRRTDDGRLQLTSRCAMLLALLGLASGFLSGLFGVGGGFVIVPALVLFSGMPMHRAVGTSLLVIVLVSLTGVASHIAAGRELSWGVTALFLVGGVMGMLIGTRLGRFLSGPRLQRVFAVSILTVAVFILSRTMIL